MKISKWVIYFIALILLATPFILIRSHWLNKSVRTKAVVLYANKRFRSTQTYPVLQYRASGHTVTIAGNANLPYVAGDSVAINYNPDNIQDFKVDSFNERWKDLLIYASPFFIFYTFMFLGKGIIPQKVTIGVHRKE